jgi:hypothetical protein
MQRQNKQRPEARDCPVLITHKIEEGKLYRDWHRLGTPDRKVTENSNTGTQRTLPQQHRNSKNSSACRHSFNVFHQQNPLNIPCRR